MALFAILSAAGAWISWRNNPMYSNRATLRFVVVVGLAVAAVVGAIVGVVNLAASLPEPIELAAILGTTLVCTIALIWVIVAVTTPPTAPIPSSARLATFHRAALRPWAVRFGWGVLVVTLLAIVLPEGGKEVDYAVGGMLVFLGVVMLSAGYIGALGLDRSLTAIEASPWVHWQYTPDQWRAWTAVEVARAQAAVPADAWPVYLKRLAVPLIAIAIGTFVFNPGPWLYDACYVAASWIAIGGIVVLAVRGNSHAGARLYKVLQRAAPEAYFGPGGLFVDGAYRQWLTVSEYLLEATIDERAPRSLAFLFEKIEPGPNAPAAIRQNVLIPSDAEADIARLQTALANACPKAHIALA